MTRRLVVVRPEPGNSRTAAAARAAGWTVEQMPLFAVEPLPWSPPDPSRYDVLILTSANAVRHSGPGLETLRALPVAAVGEATARAAREAGLEVVLTGDADAAALAALAGRQGYHRLLHLAGHDHVAIGADAVAVYANRPVAPPLDAAEQLRGATVLLHSARAARAVAALLPDRGRTTIAALSGAVAHAAGSGWRAVTVAALPNDETLLAAAAALAD